MKIIEASKYKFFVFKYSLIDLIIEYKKNIKNIKYPKTPVSDKISKWN